MEKSHLAQLIASFSGAERRDIRKFLESPYFNVRKDVLQLFDWFCESAAPDKSAAKRNLFGDDSPPDQELRLRMTYLMRLLERYIAQKEFDADSMGRDVLLATGLRRRGLGTQFGRLQQWLDKNLERQPLRDAKFHDAKFRLYWEAHQLESVENPSATEHLLTASASADVAYLAQKLRLLCLLAAHRAVYRADYQAVWENEVVDFAQKNFEQTEPVIAVYLHCYRTLQHPEDEANFQNFKKMLLEYEAKFSPEENRSLFIWAINFCVRRLNAGEKRYFQEVSDLYKAGLESGVLLENGLLTTYAYSNVVAAGLQSADLEWVAFFIHQYKNNLEKRQRESTFSFNLARLEFARRRFGAVLELLQKANYRDPLLNLAAKTLLLKTWFELGETDILLSHLDAMRNYIHRKRVLGYHRSTYLNIVKYADKLMKTNLLNKKEIEKLRAAILAEEHLTEREWLLGRLG